MVWYHTLSRILWNPLPQTLQHLISKINGYCLTLRVSAHAIPFFCWRYQLDAKELAQFKPFSGQATYQSFQDFFTRKLLNPIKGEGSQLWPCQGFICEHGAVKDVNQTVIKKQRTTIDEVFRDIQVPAHYDYVNIFLHNHNYHHFHAPVAGKIRRIEHVPGKLTFLRPWFYRRKNVSLPAILNCRVLINILDSNQRLWYLAIVGGMGVGGIVLADNIFLGAQVMAGQEIGWFELGSTICMAVPIKISPKRYLTKIMAGDVIH